MQKEKKRKNLMNKNRKQTDVVLGERNFDCTIRINMPSECCAAKKWEKHDLPNMKSQRIRINIF